MEHGCRLLSFDAHFNEISRLRPLSIHRASARRASTARSRLRSTPVKMVCSEASYRNWACESPRDGLNYLKSERPDYWTRRAELIVILGYLSGMGSHAGMEHWRADAEAASLLSGLMTNDYAGSSGACV